MLFKFHDFTHLYSVQHQPTSQTIESDISKCVWIKFAKENWEEKKHQLFKSFQQQC